MIDQCIKGTLAEYVPSAEQPWNKRRVLHLFNRIAYGATPNEVKDALKKGPLALIDELLDEASNYPLPDENFFEWAYIQNDTENRDRSGRRHLLIQYWMNEMLKQGVRHKLSFFWSNHFVTSTIDIGNRATWLFQYYYILQKNALGDFKQFVFDIGRTPSMLRYLNGDKNIKKRPNENYGRELLELFTMGEGNYSQDDIEEVSRALTGWYIQYRNPVTKEIEHAPNRYNEFLFNKKNHDFDEKTVFGVTYTPEQDEDGEDDYQKVHDIIFDQKKNEIAMYICSKLYKFYMYADPDKEIISGLAATFISNNFQIKPVLRQLFKSEHFFDQHMIGNKIKSHVDWFMSYYKLLGIELEKDFFYYDYDGPVHPDNPRKKYALYYAANICRTLGQEIFSPINVAGWPGHRDWLNEFQLVNRWKYLTATIISNLIYLPTENRVIDLLKDLSNNSKDPEIVTDAFLEHFVSIKLSDKTRMLALNSFKDPVPVNYFEDGSWNLDFDEVPRQFLSLMGYVITLPEYQLT